MSDTTDKEIQKASDAIDKALGRMNKNNRGETAVNILAVVRNLNDHIASKIWADIEPTQRMDINKVASKFANKKPLQYIWRFDKYLRKSVSHFTPSSDGAERLMIKYYRYLLEHKKLVKRRYNLDIIKNIDIFLEDIDEQTKEYYEKVAAKILTTQTIFQDNNGFDNYYIHRAKPFFVNHDIYFEVTLEPAGEKPNKFNRITAFTKHDMITNYAVALRFVESYIDAFSVRIPIKIITDWEVSIRPCEINNFARILGVNLFVQRGNNDYKALMKYLKLNQTTLIEIIDLPDDEYANAKESVSASTKEKHSKIFALLDDCRKYSLEKSIDANMLRYLLCRMNNRIIKLQWPENSDDRSPTLYMSRKSFPFKKMPFSFNPKGHESNLYDLFDSISTDGRELELLARVIENNTEHEGKLFTPIAELSQFGDAKEIAEGIEKYNSKLYSGFCPDSELDIYCDHVSNKGHELTTVNIIKELFALSSSGSTLSECFTDELVNALELLSDKKEKLDDPIKKDILIKMFEQSRVHFIHGAAGTGKSTLINHIAHLLSEKNRIFLAKTNPAVENLRRKVNIHEAGDEFITIDKFIKNSKYGIFDYDVIIVDECSTIKNEEIIQIINRVGDGVLVLAGDTYQIESIGFGNWFNISKAVMPKYCSHELTTPYRSTDESLKDLWKEVRSMTADNVVLEQMVRNDYSNIIDESIFERKARDEIILCLNYNGLYGLNNINKLLQIANTNKATEIGLYTFKVGDPVLFNDSERFKVLYNNLKGYILDIEAQANRVRFVLEVELELTSDDVEQYSDLELIESGERTSKVAFHVNIRPPYSSDEEENDNAHVLPFQVAYAVSIHKSQGLEYDSVKIVISDDSEDRITHNIFYTAITRAKEHLTIFWSPEVCNRVLAKLKPKDDNKDYLLLKNKYELSN